MKFTSGIFLVLLFAFAEASPGMAMGSKSHRAQGVDAQTFFDLLDYDVPEVARQIPRYEDELLALCDRITAGRGPISHPAAMTLGYAAFYIGNANYGAYYGKIPYDELTRYRRQAPRDAGLREELAARENLAYILGEMARNAAPEEEVLHGITSAADFRYDLFKHGKPSQRSIEALLATTEAMPSFNIYATYNVLQLDGTELTDAQEARLFALYQQRVQHRDPCHGSGRKSHVCDPDRTIVPHLLQEVVLFEGDMYFQHAIRLLRRDPSAAEGWNLVRQAQALYEQGYAGYHGVPRLFRKYMAKPVYDWALRSTLDHRIQQVKQTIERRSLPGPAFWSGKLIQDTYKCSSCHSR